MSQASQPKAKAVGRAARARARSLADWLRAYTDDELATLVRARPDLVMPVPHDTSMLALRASERTHVARALDGLDAFTLSIVDRLLLLEHPLTAEAITATGGEPARAALQHLIDLSLVWGTDELTPVSGLIGAVEHPAGLGRSVSTLLRRLDRTIVAAILAVHGLPRSADPDENAARLARTLQASVDALTAPERQVLTHVDAGGGVAAVSNAYVVSDPDDPSPVRRLLARGLLIPLDMETAEVPREVGLALRGNDWLPTVSPVPPLLAPEAARRQDADQEAALVGAGIVRLTAALLDEWSRRPPSELKSGGLGQRDLKAAARVLETDELTATLLIETARAAGLVGRTTTLDSHFAPTPAYDAWLRLDIPARWAALAKAWYESPLDASVIGMRDDRDKTAAPLTGAVVHPPVRRLRHAALGVLADAPPDVSPTRESVVDRLNWLAPRRFRADNTHLLVRVLQEAAAIGVTAGGQLAAYARPLLHGDTADAARLLTAALPDPIDHLLLQADLTAIAPGLLRPVLADELGLIADVESSGSATVYRFSSRTIRRGLDVGLDAATILALLERIGRPAVPQTLSYLVEDTARRHGQLRVGSAGAYIRCDDEALLAEVTVEKQCANLRLRRISPTVVVSPLGVAALVEGLRSAGYAPVAERGDGTVNLGRVQGARAPRAIPTPLGERVPDEASIRRLIASLRSGDRISDTPVSAPLRALGISASLGLLEQAIQEQRPILLGYVNAQGRDSRRVVDPESVSGGLLTGYDHQSQERRSFALSRITELGLADEGGA